MIKVECYIDDQLVFDADVRSAVGNMNLTNWDDDEIRSGTTREDNLYAYELEQDGSNLVVLSNGIDASGDVSGNARHYAWQRVPSFGTDNQHGIKYNDKYSHIMFLYDRYYYYFYLTAAGLPFIADLDDVDYYVILLWAYDYGGRNEWMIAENYLSGSDASDTIA